MVVGRTCAGTSIARAVAKPTASSSSAIRIALATPAIHSARPSGIAITATSLKTTPMPIAKLRARSLNGHDTDAASLLTELSAEREHRLDHNRSCHPRLASKPRPRTEGEVIAQRQTLQRTHGSQIFGAHGYLHTTGRAQRSCPAQVHQPRAAL